MFWRSLMGNSRPQCGKGEADAVGEEEVGGGVLGRGVAVEDDEFGPVAFGQAGHTGRRFNNQRRTDGQK